MQPELVSDFIINNTNDIISTFVPQPNFGFTQRTTTTPLFHTFLLLLLSNEYGQFYLTSQQQNQFLNCYYENIYRVIQLASLDQLVDMDVLLRNNFQSEEYVASVNQSSAIADTQSDSIEQVVGNTTMQNTSNSTTHNNYTSSGSENSSSEIITENTNEYTSSNSNETNTSNTSVVGATNSRGVSLALPLPNQSNQGVTVGIPLLSGTDVDGIGVGLPDLSQSYTDIADQSNSYQSSQHNSDDTKSIVQTTATSETTDNGSNETTSNATSSSETDGTQTHNGFGQGVEQGNTNINVDTNTESKSKTGSSGFVGSRRKGFTTNAIVATQLYAMLKGYQEIGTALSWWIDQFRWIEPIIGMDTWCEDKQIYV